VQLAVAAGRVPAGRAARLLTLHECAHCTKALSTPGHGCFTAALGSARCFAADQ
jgi:hypothetical protein